MIDLPAGLAPWARQLSALPTDLALALAPWVGRLALAMGPLSQSHKQRGGEPDGYSGLARRGSYERLVTAEWGVADLFPEEFLRRACSGEHLFLELARTEPQVAVRSVAIVSAGPAQLGAPRLAHIAALVVLARRAAAAGASFSWGVLEDGQHRLTDGLDETGIQRLLASRTAVAAGDDAITSWLDALGVEVDRDVWFVGDSRDAATARRAGIACLVVRDLLDPNIRALEIEVERRGPCSRLRLDLPEPDLCARLLRDPYARGGGSPTAATSAGPANEVRFAPGGRRLLVRLTDGGVESWPLPTSLRDKIGNPRRWMLPRGHSLVALGIGRRSVIAATATGDDPTAIELSYSNNHRIRVLLPKQAQGALSVELNAGSRLRVGSCGIVRLRDQADDLIINVLGHLLVVVGFKLWPRHGTVLNALPFNAAAGESAPLAFATAFFAKSLVWAEQHENAQIHVIEATSGGNRQVQHLGARAEPDVQFGFAVPQADSWGAVAVACDVDHRRVAGPKLQPSKVRSIAPVVGVCVRDGVPALLTRPHPYRLAWIAGDRRELLPTAAAPISSVAVCALQPNVAWVTEAGEVVVYSMAHRAVLLRRLPGASQ